jgi:hypothetical protein
MSKVEKETKKEEENESDEGSETSESSIEVNSLVIKKETSKTLTIDNDSYQKLVLFLQDLINSNNILKEKLNKTYSTESTQTEKINIEEENKNEKEKENENEKNLIQNLENQNKELLEKNKELKLEIEKNLKEIEQLKLDLLKHN